MHGSIHFPRRAGWFALLAVLLFSVALIPMTPTQAQTIPTATPTDPLWIAFSKTRDALQQKFHVDLTIVQSWNWTETPFDGGIDDCVKLADPNSARQLFYGWRFIITSLDGRQFEGRSSFDATIVTACDTVTTTAAPTAAPSNGSLPPPVAGSAAGGSFELGGQVTGGLSAGTVGVMQRAGMKWVKQQVVYELGQDPSPVGGLIGAAHAAGLKILISLVGDPTQMGDYGSYVNTFAGFAAGIAGEGADAIEVWNESNINREWPTGQISGATYVQLLAATYNAVKSKNGGVMVISGAPSPTGAEAAYPGQVENDDHWLRDMVGAGGLQYADCVGAHFNDGTTPPTANSGAPVQSASYTWYLPGMLGTYQGITGGQKPLCFTELGYLSMDGTNQALPSNFSWASGTTVADQASWLAGAASSLAQNGGVRLMIVWNVDSSVFTATDPQGGYAIVRPDGSCPACDSLGAVMQ